MPTPPCVNCFFFYAVLRCFVASTTREQRKCGSSISYGEEKVKSFSKLISWFHRGVVQKLYFCIFATQMLYKYVNQKADCCREGR